jgi:hypothetical protein
MVSYKSLYTLPYSVLIVFELLCLGGVIILQTYLEIGEVPDLWCSWSSTRLHELFTRWGAQGRLNYLYLGAVDLFPYMWGYKLLTGRMFLSLRPNSSWWLAAIIPWAADVGENIVNMSLVYFFDDIPRASFDWWSDVASLFNVIKWSTFILCFVAIAGLWFTRDKQKKKN